MRLGGAAGDNLFNGIRLNGIRLNGIRLNGGRLYRRGREGWDRNRRTDRDGFERAHRSIAGRIDGTAQFGKSVQTEGQELLPVRQQKQRDRMIGGHCGIDRPGGGMHNHVGEFFGVLGPTRLQRHTRGANGRQHGLTRGISTGRHPPRVSGRGDRAGDSLFRGIGLLHAQFRAGGKLRRLSQGRCDGRTEFLAAIQ